MSKPSDIPQDVAVAALETVLRPLGTSLRHYMPASKEAAIEAMQGVLAAQAERSRESLRPILTELYGDVVWNAYNTGIERADGKWTDAGMSDAEQLRRDLGCADIPQPIEAMKLSLPGLIERKVADAIRNGSEA